MRAARARTRADCDWFIFRDSLPDVHILNVAVGDTPEMDHANTVIMQCSRQIDLVCSMIQVTADYTAQWCETSNAITRKILLCRRDLMPLVFLKVVSSSGLLSHSHISATDLPVYLEAWQRGAPSP